MRTMLRRRSSPRLLVVAAFGVWLLTSAYMLTVLGDELDMDSVFYGYSGTTGRTVSYGPSYVPSADNPPPAVVVVFGAVGVIVGLPATLPKRWFSKALYGSAILTGFLLAGTVLRLGLLLVPVLALQVWALSRSRQMKRQLRAVGLDEHASDLD